MPGHQIHHRQHHQQHQYASGKIPDARESLENHSMQDLNGMDKSIASHDHGNGVIYWVFLRLLHSSVKQSRR
jgi:hypothetical protein